MLTFDDFNRIVQPHHERIVAQHEADRLRALNAELVGVLQEVESFLDGRADVVDGSYGIPAPNAEMSLLAEVRAVIAKAEGQS